VTPTTLPDLTINVGVPYTYDISGFSSSDPNCPQTGYKILMPEADMTYNLTIAEITVPPTDCTPPNEISC